MDIKELYHNLKDAYTNSNLNRITGILISLYKSKNYRKIREIANKISKYIIIEEEKDAKCFSKLIMLYHPDKGVHFRKKIQQHYKQNDYERLNKYAHVLLLAEIKTEETTTIDVDIDYNPEYAWDEASTDGFQFIDAEDDFETVDFERTFYNLIKIREYGNVEIEFPSYYLEDIEEFELAYCGLESLDGVEHCIHIRNLDVSNNAICNLENLWGLENLEELYLANNQIGYIDALSNLENLKVLDISGNEIDDITPILNLVNLEFVNLFGNPVSGSQIEILHEKGIIVMAENEHEQLK